ncbi:MAG TPA: N-acetyl-gamma-glutamyl-phosphate reductase [Candidatus Dormibacteraeota bacterium]|nr:N-acetyl-gamma-glutamyl-phosphate reductase [Candidatus Dormibacteraeota bacterium]
MTRLRAAVVGAAGYTGGELLRLLLGHPHVDIVAATSERLAGAYAHHTHPVLRGRTALRFSTPAELPPCDVAFSALPHAETEASIEALRACAPLVIDLSADFRLREAAAYQRWYGRDHSRPDLLASAIYALPEIDRHRIRDAELLATGGCVATAAILGLLPLARAGVVDTAQYVVVDAKVGSSAAGAQPGPSSHHPHRSGTMRSFAPTGHRHTAEVIQETGLRNVAVSVTAVEAVRGVLVTAHVPLADDTVDDRLLRSILREAYAAEPFVRVVHEAKGIHRHPEPKLLCGTNICEVGFERDPHTPRATILAAIDNLGKGSAGQAVHALNVHAGMDECAGIDFPGLYPI